MGRRGRPRLQTPSAELLGRIDHVLEIVFRGNQRAMADSLGVSKGLVSKVATRAQRPSEAFLDAIARLPMVNGDWLRYGRGLPLLPSTVGSLAVAEVILPGPPGTHTGLLHGERCAVAAALERETRYWLRVGGHFAIASVPEMRIAARDLLLMETARDHLDRLDVLDGQLCAIAISSETQTTYAFARLTIKKGKLLATVYHPEIRNEVAEAGPKLTNKEFIDAMNQPTRMKIDRRRPRAPTDQAAAEGMPAPQTDEGTSRQPDYPGGRQLTGTNEVVGLVLLLQRSLTPV